MQLSYYHKMYSCLALAPTIRSKTYFTHPRSAENLSWNMARYSQQTVANFVLMVEIIQENHLISYKSNPDDFEGIIKSCKYKFDAGDVDAKWKKTTLTNTEDWCARS